MTSRRWAAVVFISLSLNVLLMGIVATPYLNRNRDAAQRMSVYTVPWALRIVGEEIGPMARRSYVKYQSNMARDRKVLARDYLAVNEILAASQFDRTAFSDALAKLRADSQSAQATMHESMSEFVVGLSLDQRRQLTDFVDEWSRNREQRAIRRDEIIERKDRRDNPSK